MLFKSSSSSDYKQYDDQECELVRSLVEEDDKHDVEVLPVFIVRFQDGTEIEAFSDELLNPVSEVTAVSTAFGTMRKFYC